MQIFRSTDINYSVEIIWNKLSSFDGMETYLSIVTKSKVDGKG